MSINRDSWKVGFFFNVFCSEFRILSLIAGLRAGLFSFIARECCSASLLLASKLFIRQWSFPFGCGQCFSLSKRDWLLVFVFIPSFTHRLRIVSLDNPFSRSINLRLFP